MSESWEADVFRVPDVSWQTQAPPSRHPVPAQYVPELEVGDEVTIGIPGHYFLDGQLVALAERKRTTLSEHANEEDLLPVAAPFAFWLAKAFPKVGLTMQWWPLAQTWVYRDAVQPGEQRPHEASGSDVEPGTWLHHVRPTLGEPPVRRPRPARDAGSLAGRVVRLQHEPGAWSWWVAVSEPVDRDGDFVVHVMQPSDFWLAQAVFKPTEKARAVPLYRLFVYD